MPIKIAMAEDHTLVRQALAALIEQDHRFRVVAQVNDGQKLLDYLEQAAELPDICVLDICMPGLNGQQALKQIRERWPEVRVLILSMFITEFNILRVLKAGANGVFSKSDDAARLPAALEEIYTEGYYSSAYVSKDLIKAARRNSIASVNITDREAEFLKLCATELTYVQIADKLGIGKRTVDGYRENLFQKLHISSRTGLAMFAIQSGLVVI